MDQKILQTLVPVHGSQIRAMENGVQSVKTEQELITDFLETTFYVIQPETPSPVIAAMRFPLTPAVLQKLQEMNPGHNFKKIEQSSVVHVLRKAGFQAAIASPIRSRRPGFNIQLFSTKFVMLVSWTDPTHTAPHGTWGKFVPKYKHALEQAGYIVDHPHPQATDLLYVIRQGGKEE